VSAVVASTATPDEPAPVLRPLGEAVADLERQMIRAALESTGGNKASAARALGISRATLYQKLEEYQGVSDP
ncbi:hypothetical protein E4K72_04470, partial [Oxalobacteraceae bacterium OM1]